MKRFLAGLALATPFLGSAQEGEQALLWRISGNGLERPGYIYGTVHSKDERAYTYVAAVKDAMQEVNTVAGELDLDASRKGAANLMSKMLMPDDQRLEDLYKKKDWAKVDAYLKTELGFMAVMVQRMKPFFVMATLTEKAMGGKREMVLDEHLMAHAKANAHRTIGLETLDEQLRAMDALSLKEQAAMLLDHVKGNSAHEMLDSMLDAYAKQDIDALMNISRTSGSMPEKMERALLTDRNVVMSHRLDSVLRADGSTMLLVGAAHLPGEAGMLHLLRSKGYKTEAVAIEAVKAKEYGPALRIGSGIHYVNDTLAFGMDMLGIPERTNETDDIMIGVKQDDRGTAVSVFNLPNDVTAMDLDSLLSKEFPLFMIGEVEPRLVQGFNGSTFVLEKDGKKMDVLMVQRGDRAYLAASFGPNAIENRQALDSFHFTDLPQ